MVAVASITITPADVAAAYHARDGRSCVALGDMMLACRRALGISQQELARRTGITPGTLHHHESVANSTMRDEIEKGLLTFKEARCLADLGWYRGANFRRDERLPEIVALFTSGRLSSAYVERLVSIAKANPAKSVDELVTILISKAKVIPKAYRPALLKKIPAITSKALQSRLLSLAGEVEAWGMQERCEVERMPVLSAARCLTDRLARVVFKTGGVRAPVGVDSLPTVAEAAVAHAGANGVGNRRLALLLEEPDRRPRKGQEVLL